MNSKTKLYSLETDNKGLLECLSEWPSQLYCLSRDGGPTPCFGILPLKKVSSLKRFHYIEDTMLNTNAPKGAGLGNRFTEGTRTRQSCECLGGLWLGKTQMMPTKVTEKTLEHTVPVKAMAGDGTKFFCVSGERHSRIYMVDE